MLEDLTWSFSICGIVRGGEKEKERLQNVMTFGQKTSPAQVQCPQKEDSETTKSINESQEPFAQSGSLLSDRCHEMC